jgi:hypothetical protein
VCGQHDFDAVVDIGPFVMLVGTKPAPACRSSGDGGLVVRLPRAVASITLPPMIVRATVATGKNRLDNSIAAIGQGRCGPVVLLVKRVRLGRRQGQRGRNRPRAAEQKAAGSMVSGDQRPARQASSASLTQSALTTADAQLRRRRPDETLRPVLLCRHLHLVIRPLSAKI